MRNYLQADPTGTGWKHVSANSLWLPNMSDLPSNLTDDATHEFLTTVGFPAMKLKEIGWDSTHLKEEAGGNLQEFDADELYGLQYLDESPPTNFAFHIGSVDTSMVMVGGEDGDVVHYDPDGWDHGDGYQGLVATSLGRLVILLWMLAEVVERSGLMIISGLAGEEEDDELGERVLNKLRERMVKYDDCVEEGSKFWDGIFETFL